MDMNELLRQHQIALFNAGSAGIRPDRQVCRILAAFYSLCIRSLRVSWGLPLAF